MWILIFSSIGKMQIQWNITFGLCRYYITTQKRYLIFQGENFPCALASVYTHSNDPWVSLVPAALLPSLYKKYSAAPHHNPFFWQLGVAQVAERNVVILTRLGSNPLLWHACFFRKPIVDSRPWPWAVKNSVYPGYHPQNTEKYAVGLRGNALCRQKENTAPSFGCAFILLVGFIFRFF